MFLNMASETKKTKVEKTIERFKGKPLPEDIKRPFISTKELNVLIEKQVEYLTDSLGTDFDVLKLYRDHWNAIRTHAMESKTHSPS